MYYVTRSLHGPEFVWRRLPALFCFFLLSTVYTSTSSRLLSSSSAECIVQKCPGVGTGKKRIADVATGNTAIKPLFGNAKL